MNELQVINLDNTDITVWDFPALKAELQAYLSEYDNLVYTDETIKDAKKDKSKLNNVKKVIEDARKAYKARCMAPYDAIEPQIKELTEMIENSKMKIDETVKEYEKFQKEIKEKKIRSYYDQVSGRLGIYADRIYGKLFDPKWTNVSTSVSIYKEGVQNAIAKAERDLNMIRALNSPFEETLIDLYIETISMEAVELKNAELMQAVDRAGISDTASASAVESSDISNTERPVSSGEGTLVRIHASQSKLNQICDFMKVIGVQYEIL